VVEAFFDTNVLLYLLSEDTTKAERAEALLGGGGVISVQVLNEFVSVARRKANLPWPELREVLDTLKSALTVQDLRLETHEKALDIAERYRLGIYDAQILAAARLSGCATVYSEDMQDGLEIESALRLRNPFASR
jgi:predicted nucleic acid-binding protein